DKPMVLRVSGGTSVLQEDLSHETITTSVKEALRLNAAAVALSIFVGAPHEHESIVNLAHLVNEAEEYGLPVLAVTAVGKEHDTPVPMIRAVRAIVHDKATVNEAAALLKGARGRK